MAKKEKDPALLAAELEEARRELDEERLKFETFATMSHEMRTLLSGVIGITALLLDTELSPEQKDYAKRIRASGDALLAIINDVLDFAKIDRGKIDLDVVDVDVRRVVEDVGDLLAERAHSKRIELVTWVEDDLPGGLRGDPARLRQILINLVGNAIKFTDRGEVLLRASFDGGVDGAARVRFEVKDSGIGISREGQSRLFQAYSQADRARSRGGTGLGLIIAKRLVDAMGGEIGVTSEEGKGSTFWFTVRLARRRSGAVTAPIPRADFHGRRALVVAESAIARDAVRRHLAVFGVEAEGAADGGAALALLRSAAEADRPFHVAFVDAELPDADGMALARTVGDNGALARTKVVMMTPVGYHAPGPGAPSSLIGTLTKPVRQAALLACLQKSTSPDGEVVRSAGSRAPSSAKEPKPGPRPRVLVVEDNVINQKVAVFMLEKRGYAADVVRHGLEAIDAAASHHYAAIFMDCHMPRFDGFQATTEIRRREGAGRRTPIIALTADARPGAREKCLAMGMDDYLAKPLVNEELDAALRRWCPIGEARPASRAPASAGRARSAGPGAGSARSAGPPEAIASALDPDAFAKLRELSTDDADLVAEVIGIFLHDAPERLAVLRAAAERGDVAELTRVAHALKGSAGQLGARGMHAIAGRLEQIARAGAVEGAADLIRALEAELDVVRAAMTAELERGRA